MSKQKKQLLVNWVYYPPAGHVIEALKHAYAYYLPNQEQIEVSLLLNAASTPALTEPCAWVSKVYPVSLAEVIADQEQAACLQAIPQSWDYLINDPRTRAEAFMPNWDEPELIATQQVYAGCCMPANGRASQAVFKCVGMTRDYMDLTRRYPTWPMPNCPIQRRQIPNYLCSVTNTMAQNFASSHAVGRASPKAHQCMLPAEICTTLAAIPNLRIYVTGLSEAGAGERGRSITKQEIDQLAAQLPRWSTVMTSGCGTRSR